MGDGPFRREVRSRTDRRRARRPRTKRPRGARRSTQRVLHVIEMRSSNGARARVCTLESVLGLTFVTSDDARMRPLTCALGCLTFLMDSSRLLVVRGTNAGRRDALRDLRSLWVSAENHGAEDVEMGGGVPEC
jgi:hypothetical protein